MPHSWTSIADVATTLVTAAGDEKAHGQAWLVPTNAPLTIRQIADRFSQANGKPKGKITSIPYAGLWTMGLFLPMLRELRTTAYQFSKPFVLDSSLTEQTLGLTPTPIDQALASITPTA